MESQDTDEESESESESGECRALSALVYASFYTSSAAVMGHVPGFEPRAKVKEERPDDYPQVPSPGVQVKQEPLWDPAPVKIKSDSETSMKRNKSNQADEEESKRSQADEVIEKPDVDPSALDISMVSTLKGEKQPRRISTSLVSLRCNLCDRLCSTAQLLQSHLMVHVGQGLLTWQQVTDIMYDLSPPLAKKLKTTDVGVIDIKPASEYSAISVTGTSHLTAALPTYNSSTWDDGNKVQDNIHGGRELLTVQPPLCTLLSSGEEEDLHEEDPDQRLAVRQDIKLGKSGELPKNCHECVFCMKICETHQHLCWHYQVHVTEGVMTKDDLVELTQIEYLSFLLSSDLSRTEPRYPIITQDTAEPKKLNVILQGKRVLDQQTQQPAVTSSKACSQLNLGVEIQAIKVEPPSEETVPRPEVIEVNDDTAIPECSAGCSNGHSQKVTENEQNVLVVADDSEDKECTGTSKEVLCFICGERFASAANFKTHFQSHHVSEPPAKSNRKQCSLPAGGVPTKITEHKLPRKKAPKGALPSLSSAASIHRCPFCDRSYLKMVNFQTHLGLHVLQGVLTVEQMQGILGLENTEVRKSSGHGCPVCQRNFKTFFHYEKHLAIHWTKGELDLESAKELLGGARSGMGRSTQSSVAAKLTAERFTDKSADTLPTISARKTVTKKAGRLSSKSSNVPAKCHTVSSTLVPVSSKSKTNSGKSTSRTVPHKAKVSKDLRTVSPKTKTVAFPLSPAMPVLEGKCCLATTKSSELIHQVNDPTDIYANAKSTFFGHSHRKKRHLSSSGAGQPLNKRQKTGKDDSGLLDNVRNTSPVKSLAHISHKCLFCSKHFTYKSILSNHIKLFHKDDSIAAKPVQEIKHKRHVCSVCGKAFVYKKVLWLHQRRHSGQKPHCCPVCRKNFLVNYSFIIHFRLYHMKEEKLVNANIDELKDEVKEHSQEQRAVAEERQVELIIREWNAEEQEREEYSRKKTERNVGKKGRKKRKEKKEQDRKESKEENDWKMDEEKIGQEKREIEGGKGENVNQELPHKKPDSEKHYLPMSQEELPDKKMTNKGKKNCSTPDEKDSKTCNGNILDVLYEKHCDCFNSSLGNQKLKGCQPLCSGNDYHTQESELEKKSVIALNQILEASKCYNIADSDACKMVRNGSDVDNLHHSELGHSVDHSCKESAVVAKSAGNRAPNPPMTVTMSFAVSCKTPPSYSGQNTSRPNYKFDFKLIASDDPSKGVNITHEDVDGHKSENKESRRKCKDGSHKSIDQEKYSHNHKDSQKHRDSKKKEAHGCKKHQVEKCRKFLDHKKYDDVKTKELVKRHGNDKTKRTHNHKLCEDIKAKEVQDPKRHRDEETKRLHNHKLCEDIKTKEVQDAKMHRDEKNERSHDHKQSEDIKVKEVLDLQRCGDENTTKSHDGKKHGDENTTKNHGVKKHGDENTAKIHGGKKHGNENTTKIHGGKKHGDENTAKNHDAKKRGDENTRKKCDGKKHGDENTKKKLDGKKHGEEKTIKIQDGKKHGDENTTKVLEGKKHGDEKTTKSRDVKKHGDENTTKIHVVKRYGDGKTKEGLVLKKVGKEKTKAVHDLKRHGDEKSKNKHDYKKHSDTMLRESCSLRNHRVEIIKEVSCLKKDGSVKETHHEKRHGDEKARMQLHFEKNNKLHCQKDEKITEGSELKVHKDVNLKNVIDKTRGGHEFSEHRVNNKNGHDNSKKVLQTKKGHDENTLMEHSCGKSRSRETKQYKSKEEHSVTKSNLKTFSPEKITTLPPSKQSLFSPKRHRSTDFSFSTDNPLSAAVCNSTSDRTERSDSEGEVRWNCRIPSSPCCLGYDCVEVRDSWKCLKGFKIPKILQPPNVSESKSSSCSSKGDKRNLSDKDESNQLHLSEDPKVLRDPKLQCTYCNRIFVCEKALKLHRRSDKKQKCCICLRLYSNTSEMKEHDELHYIVTPFACKVCGVNYAWKLNMMMHYSKSHIRNGAIVCTDCADMPKFNSHVELKNHLAKEHPHKYVCNVCHKDYIHAKAVLDHFRLTHAKALQCAKCRLPCYSEVQLVEHWATKHPEKIPPKVIRCLKFPKVGSLQTVTGTHEAKQPVENSQNTTRAVPSRSIGEMNRLSCNKCKEAFSDSEHLTKHQTTCHTQQVYQCTICELSFPCEVDWSDHALMYHMNIDRCQFCGQSFSQVSVFDTHLQEHDMKLSHRRQFTCPRCPAKWSQKVYLLDHFRRMHPDIISRIVKANQWMG